MYPDGYNFIVHQITQTDLFSKWLSKLKDRRAVARVLVKIEALRLGNAGDSKSLGAGLHELRIDYGPGYRIYYTRRSGFVVLLLYGGDKSSQGRDISRARKALSELGKE